MNAAADLQVLHLESRRIGDRATYFFRELTSRCLVPKMVKNGNKIPQRIWGQSDA